jgi:hypothetical protein
MQTTPRYSVALHFAGGWYANLLQHRGANHFKLMIQGPRGNKKLSRRRAITNALDAMQSWGAPVAALGLWGLMRAGLLTRGWFMYICILLFTFGGLRGFISIVRKRLGTLKHIVTVVNAKSGTPEEVRRRRRVLHRTFLTLFMDMSLTFFISVAMPASIVLLGSTFNSKTMAIHIVVMYIPTVIALGLSNARLCVVGREKKRIKKMQTLASTRPHRSGRAGASLAPSSGLSSVGGSCVQGSDV